MADFEVQAVQRNEHRAAVRSMYIGVMNMNQQTVGLLFRPQSHSLYHVPPGPGQVLCASLLFLGISKEDFYCSE